jgi:hypothetical protein
VKKPGKFHSYYYGSNMHIYALAQLNHHEFIIIIMFGEVYQVIRIEDNTMMYI